CPSTTEPCASISCIETGYDRAFHYTRRRRRRGQEYATGGHWSVAATAAPGGCPHARTRRYTTGRGDTQRAHGHLRRTDAGLQRVTVDVRRARRAYGTGD